MIILIIMIFTAVVSAHAMMSAGTLTRLPTKTESVVMHPSSIPGTVKIPSSILGTVKIPSVIPGTVKIPSVVQGTVNQQKVSINEPEKPIRKEISPEALDLLNKHRQETLDKEMKSRMVQPKPSYTINPNHDLNHWLILK